jgi:hypothetical protein
MVRPHQCDGTKVSQTTFDSASDAPLTIPHRSIYQGRQNSFEFSNEDLRSDLSEEELERISGGLLAGKIAIIAILIAL